jgi:hypothetical protein
MGLYSGATPVSSVRDVIPPLLKLATNNREGLLVSLTDDATMRRFVEVLLRSETRCRDLLTDRSYAYSSLSEAFDDSGLSIGDRVRLADETNLLRTIHALVRHQGYVPEWIDKAQQISREVGMSRESRSAAYDIIRSLNMVASDQKRVIGLIRKYSDSSLPLETLARYSLEPVLCFTQRNCCPGRLFDLTYRTYPEPRSESGLKSFWIWMDAPFGMFLLRDGVPQAILSFSFSDGHDGREVKIEQMQGVYGVCCTEAAEVISPSNPKRFSPKLFGIAFRELFVAISQDVARMSDFDHIAMTGAEHNLWVKPNKWKAVPTYPRESAMEHYDAVAQRCGFKHRADGTWGRQVGDGLEDAD